MKFYIFGSSPVKDARDLAKVKTQTQTNLDAVKALIEADAKRRAEG